MEPKILTDGCGNEFKTIEWNDEYLPPFCLKEKVEAVQNMPFRPDDVIICSYPKTGTHWAREMVTFLLAQKAEPQKEGKTTMLEFPFSNVEDYASIPSPRIMTTHLRFHNLPKGILENKCRLVVTERNIKDTAVSMFNFCTNLKGGMFTGDWNGFAPMFLQGNCVYKSYFEHVKEFRQAAKDHPELPILILRYEQIKKDHLGEVGRLSKFLGLDSSPELLADIARLTDFQSMQKYKVEMMSEAAKAFTSGKNDFYRKGEVGDWKNWFTVAQSELYDAEYAKQMGEPFQEMS